MHMQLILVICMFFHANPSNSLDFASARENHEAQKLGYISLLQLAAMTSNIEFLPLLEPLLIPRVVGTMQHETARKYLVQQMQNLGWHVEQDAFTDNTPLGPLNFTNIIAKQNPDASRFLVLACHYDSLKLNGVDNFVAATDSAVSCAMMLQIAKVLAEPFNNSLNSDVSLAFIFFDGEEAFEKWGPLDSLYGSRHLAKQMAETSFPKDNLNGTSELDRMDVLVMLDLIGTQETTFHNFFRYQASNWYLHLSNIEQRLASTNLLAHSNIYKPKYFLQYQNYMKVEDDHIPFVKLGVRAVHLISIPFPAVWHTAGDNINALDFPTISDINKILCVFVAEYLNLKNYLI